MADLPPIVLMTDFGLRDPFVGIMKGVILSINPSATIVDLCHELDPGDVRSAAFALSMAFPYFPTGTIFAAVVDPGVGTGRRAVAADVGGKTVVCPDNGILSWVLHNHSLSRAVELHNPRFFLPEVSDTFHGRDVFAPVVAHLSLGVPLDRLGPPVDKLITFAIPEPIEKDEFIQGEVVYIDRFGNLVTNIARERLESWRGKSERGLGVRIGSTEIRGISGTYGDAPPERALAVFGSAGFLEIAVNRGSAAHLLGATMGSQVLVYWLDG